MDASDDGSPRSLGFVVGAQGEQHLVLGLGEMALQRDAAFATISARQQPMNPSMLSRKRGHGVVREIHEDQSEAQLTQDLIIALAQPRALQAVDKGAMKPEVALDDVCPSPIV